VKNASHYSILARALPTTVVYNLANNICLSIAGVSMNPYRFAEAHRQEFLEELKTLLRIPSISALSEHRGNIQQAAEWLKTHLEATGLTRAAIYETAGHPLVYAEWLGAGKAPTVLIYGHYDVQPVDDPEGLWKSEPFDPIERDGNLYARGASDDKGQTFVQMKVVQSLMAGGHLPVNIKFLIEGEEEVGSTHLYPFVESHKDLLKADVVVISDTGMLALDCPSIVYGLRGIAYMEIEVRGPSHDLHSGHFGGIVHNPIQALVEILAAMHDREGHVLVPGFYDRVRPLDKEERAELARTPYAPERLKNETGLSTFWGEPEYAPHERLGARPTLEINGIVGGWTGEGSKTVLPAKALAKVSCRLVPDQDPTEIEELLRRYVRSITPNTVTSEVRPVQHGNWALTDRESPYMQAALQAYEFGFGKRPVFTREGGSVPIVGAFQNVLKAPVIMMGFGLPDDNAHAPNEKFTLECYDRGIQTALKFYETIGQLA
jgi:acetylornithine deacetylase/succinyl-diaminopimelate desuccinylase-like protein